MRLATIRWRHGTSAALVTGARVAAIRPLPGRDDAVDVTALIRRPLTGKELLALADGAAADDDDIEWLPPIAHPPKNVFCVGKNYVEHVQEGARAEGLATATIPAAPVWFTKPHTALVGHGGEIVCDAAFTECLDYEGELAVVIGRRARMVSPSEALDHVFGYTVLNDITARDVQQRHLQWFRGKSADTYAPCGPWVVTADEVSDPNRFALRTYVSGELRQSDDTRNMIFNIPALIADLSQGVTLEPGDIIATGTPQGVAWGMKQPRYLRPGDEVVVEVDGIGSLRNRVVGAQHS